ncbi:ficolin-1-like [Scylla paramamosain]|uniref:ficolin-1-like n=1 Tax=Scylla paramamosain TaxID=85552 RepID=UPI003083ECA8
MRFNRPLRLISNEYLCWVFYQRQCRRSCAATSDVNMVTFFALRFAGDKGSGVASQCCYKQMGVSATSLQGLSGLRGQLERPAPGISLPWATPPPVFCAHPVESWGWTVFQQRTSDAVSHHFFRIWIINWALATWRVNSGLGLDLPHQLTSTTLQQLRIDLDDYEGEHRWAKYGFFHVGAPETKFRLSVGRYEGVFWYAACHKGNLNGYQYVGNHTSYADGINWYHWKGHHYSVKRTCMMIPLAF